MTTTPNLPPKLTDEEVNDLARANGDETDLGFIFNKGYWMSALTFGRDIESAVRTPLLARIAALEAEREQWQATVWGLARELNCLPSTFADANAHVLKAAIQLSGEITAIRTAAQAVITDRDNYGWSTDVDAAINRLREALAERAGGQV